MPDQRINIRVTRTPGPAPALSGPSPAQPSEMLPLDSLRRFPADFPAFQLVTITRVYGNGYFDVRTLSGGSRRHVRAIVDSSIWEVGWVATMGHTDRDKDDPYLKGAHPQVVQTPIVISYWISSHGTTQGAFRAGTYSSVIDLSKASEIFAGPFGDNVQNTNFLIRPTQSIVAYPIADATNIVVLDKDSAAGTLKIRALSLAGEETWTTTITATTITINSVPGHLQMQYNQERDLLVVLKYHTAAPAYDEVEFFSGATGESVGTYANTPGKAILFRGWVTIGNFLIRCHHEHITSVSAPWSPTETGTQQKILGFELSAAGVSPVTLTPIWEFHPAQLFDASNATAPAGAVIRGTLGDFVAPYLASKKAVVVPVAGHLPLASSERRNWAHFSKADLVSAAFTPDVGATAYRLDTRECRAWLAALKVADGSVAWKYEFPRLAADDPTHYVIDTASFGTAPVRADYDDGFGIHNNFSYIGLPDDQHYDTEALGTPPPSGDISIRVTLARPDTGLQSLLGKLYPQYKYWQMGAGYHFDTTTEIQSGDPKSGLNDPLPTSTNAHVPADAADNVYLAYLQPYGIVSPIHPYLHPTVATVMLDSPHIGRCGAKLTRHFDTPTAGEETHDYEVFDLPYRHTAWRSFLASWDSSGALRWRVEITFWGDDYQFSSASLSGAVPYGGSVLRIVPTSTAIFVLRTIRLPVAATTFEDPTIQFGNILDYHGHRGRRFCKTVLEAYTPATGVRMWQTVLYDPRDDGSAVLPTQNRMASQPSTRYHNTGGVMYGSETSRSGKPWVVGHFRHGTPLLEAASVSKVFTANSSGVLTLRDATLKDILLVGNSGETNKFLPDAPHVVGQNSIWYPWRDDSDEQSTDPSWDSSWAGKRRWWLRRMDA